MSILIDLTGQKFGRLIVIRRVSNNKWGHICWLCKCNCKKVKVVVGSGLKSQRIRSCGCLRKEEIIRRSTKHGHNKRGKETRTYSSWRSMVERCSNIRNKDYYNYGGRGITVCKRWLKFDNFLQDMGERPKNYSIDRIDNDGGYSRLNCRWATSKEQNRNSRNNRFVSCFGKFQCVGTWSEETKIPYLILWKRIYMYDWSPEKALTTPAKQG